MIPKSHCRVASTTGSTHVTVQLGSCLLILLGKKLVKVIYLFILPAVQAARWNIVHVQVVQAGGIMSSHQSKITSNGNDLQVTYEKKSRVEIVTANIVASN